jgi:hypothetical protein
MDDKLIRRIKENGKKNGEREKRAEGNEGEEYMDEGT